MSVQERLPFRVRGYMLDISRGKVPRMETLYSLVDRLADHGYNHLELYGERSFDYGEGTPPPYLTADEVVALGQYCSARSIELVPNQNSLGHMERWLCEDRYIDLAEMPNGGARTPWGTIQTEPTGLRAGDPDVIKFLSRLYDSLLPNYSSILAHIGCDEVFDLGQGRSARRCQELGGPGELFLDHLNKLAEILKQHNKRPIIWADMLLKHPEIVPRLPKGTISVVWGYEADHPFASQCRMLVEAGVGELWVAPGTSSWRSFAGRSANMLANIDAAVKAGYEYGATGFLLCDWGDAGHAQPIEVSYPAITIASQLCVGKDASVIQLTPDQKAWWALGNCYQELGVLCANSTVLFKKHIGLPCEPFDTRAFCRAIRNISSDGVDHREAFELVRDLMLWASGVQIPHLRERYCKVWEQANKLPGLEESLRKIRLA